MTPAIGVDLLLGVKGDGHAVMQAAFKAAVGKSIATGLKVTDAVQQRLTIWLVKTGVAPLTSRLPSAAQSRVIP